MVKTSAMKKLKMFDRVLTTSLPINYVPIKNVLLKIYSEIAERVFPVCFQAILF